MLALHLNFQGEGQLFDNFLFYILGIQGKCLAFQFLSRGIHIYFPILIGFKDRLFKGCKIGDICLKNSPS